MPEYETIYEQLGKVKWGAGSHDGVELAAAGFRFIVAKSWWYFFETCEKRIRNGGD